MSRRLWGIDLGGTKIEGVVLDEISKKVLARKRVPTESQKGYAHILGQIQSLLEMLKNEVGSSPEHVGMGTPGTMDPELKVLKNCNATALNGQNLKKDISEITGIPFLLSNDANCFAVAETKMGIIPEVMPDAQVVFGVIMGTGVGGGIVVNGRVINGAQGIGGEWGHNFLHESGGNCYCGRIGCVETVIAGPSLERYYTSISNQSLQLKEIYKLYKEKKDKYATLTMERLFDQFGRAIANVINILDPDAIVIGGGVGNIDELYTLGVERAKPYVFNHHLYTKFYKPKLGDSAGVFGAAFL